MEPGRFRLRRAALLLPALVLALLASSLLASSASSYRAIEKDYLKNHRRFRFLLCWEDIHDLLGLEARLVETVVPDDLARDAYADYLCLRLLIDRALERVSGLRKDDPGRFLPPGDLFTRALEKGGKGRTGPAVSLGMRRYLEVLAGRLEEADVAGREVEKRLVREAIERAGRNEKTFRADWDLLLDNAPPGRRNEWKRTGERLLRALEAFRLRLESLRDRLPDPTEAEKRAARKAQLDFHLRLGYGLEMDSAALLRRAGRFFLETGKELEALASSIDPDRSWREIYREAESHHPGPDGLVDLAKRCARDALAFVIDEDLVTVPEAARRFEVLPGKARGPLPFAFYRPARKGRPPAFVAIPCDPDGSPGEVRDHLEANHRHWMKVVALHEGVPGHHLQFTIAQKIDHPIRRLVSCTSYVEGWALYCEEMMGRRGYYGPLDRLTQLRMKLWRAARVLCSVSINQRGLTREGAARFLGEKLLFRKVHARKEAAMYADRPAYFCGYAVGFWQIEALREKLEAKWGETYSDRRFHDLFLSFGPMPVPLIEKVLFRR